MREDRKRAAVEALGLPRDVILGDVLLHFTGPYEVVAEFQEPSYLHRYVCENKGSRLYGSV